MAAYISAQDSLCIIEYNVENLFHPQHDSLKDDWEFTPEGLAHWNNYRYYRKVEQLSRVITNICGIFSPTIVGLCEVENSTCLSQLAQRMLHYPLKPILYESLDKRGIDVGILFDSTQVDCLSSRPIRVAEPSDGFVTRDVLYACFRVRPKGDTLHLFMCHLPSQRGGAAASEWKRQLAKSKVLTVIDSLRAVSPNAAIIVMGDMNTKPKEDMPDLHNCMLEFSRQGRGTHRYQGRWTCLDQVYLSPALTDKTAVAIYAPDWLLERDKKYLGFKPKRTLTGYRYNKNGFSDHLPVVIKIEHKPIY